MISSLNVNSSVFIGLFWLSLTLPCEELTPPFDKYYFATLVPLIFAGFLILGFVTVFIVEKESSISNRGPHLNNNYHKNRKLLFIFSPNQATMFLIGESHVEILVLYICLNMLI